MDLYDMLKNISGKDIEKELKESVFVVKDKLSNLTEERTCKIYNGYLANELRRRHISLRIINTLDLGLEYEHIFLLVPKNTDGYFLADLTFSQFNNNQECFDDLFSYGYQNIDDDSLRDYLNIVSREDITNISLEDIFFNNSQLKKR